MGSSPRPDQQPIARVVGRRIEPPPGVPPSPEARAALDSFAQRRTRVPKGIFRYASHAEMAADRERWTLEAVVATAHARDRAGR